MHNPKVRVLSCALALSLAGCSVQMVDENTVRDRSSAPAPLVIQTEAETPNITSVTAQLKDFIPSEEEVLKARACALEGMIPEQIDRLNAVIQEANLWWEHAYFYDNVFGKLSDPNSLYWNYFDQTGEIQIGWAFDGDLDMNAICEQEGLTEREFYTKYGAKVVTNNEYDAADFIATLDELIAVVQDEGLKADLQYIRDETWLAKENHSMEHANNEYKALHDLDYFLLRYGPVDVGTYVKDASTVSKYYGMLSIYD